jgi:acyl carrier protein
MDNAAVYAKLTDIFRDVLNNDEIVLAPHLTANDVAEWDSLSHVRLILTTERAFGVSFTAAQVGRLKNVGELADLVQSKMARSPQPGARA